MLREKPNKTFNLCFLGGIIITLAIGSFGYASFLKLVNPEQNTENSFLNKAEQVADKLTKNITNPN